MFFCLKTVWSFAKKLLTLTKHFLPAVPDINLMKNFVFAFAGVEAPVTSHVTKSPAEASVTLMANNSVSITKASLIVAVAEAML